jgi:hypothetical protein
MSNMMTKMMRSHAATLAADGLATEADLSVVSFVSIISFSPGDLRNPESHQQGSTDSRSDLSMTQIKRFTT